MRIPAGGYEQATAKCPDNLTAIAGGAETSEAQLTDSYRESNEQTWTVYAKSSKKPDSLQAWVVCVA